MPHGWLPVAHFPPLAWLLLCPLPSLLFPLSLSFSFSLPVSCGRLRPAHKRILGSTKAHAVAVALLSVTLALSLFRSLPCVGCFDLCKFWASPVLAGAIVAFPGRSRGRPLRSRGGCRKALVQNANGGPCAELDSVTTLVGADALK